MTDLTTDRIFAGLLGGMMLPAFEFLYGPGKAVLSVMVALAFLIVLDWLSGISAARKDKTYASKYGIDGVFRTFFMILLPAGGHLLDKAYGLPGILFGMFAFGLIHHTFKSMTANCIRAGWADWLPISALKKVSEWVESEIESKILRAQKRRDEREDVDGHG